MTINEAPYENIKFGRIVRGWWDRDALAVPVRWMWRSGKRLGSRIELVKDGLHPADESGLPINFELKLKWGVADVWAVEDLAGDGLGWASAIRLVPRGNGFEVVELRIFPRTPNDVEVWWDADDKEVEGDRLGAAPPACPRCLQLEPKGEVPKGGIDSKVFRSARIGSIRSRALEMLDKDAADHFGRIQSGEWSSRRRTSKKVGSGPQHLAEIAQAVISEHERGAVAPVKRAADKLGYSREYVRDRLNDARVSGILTRPGRGSREPGSLTRFGEKLLAEAQAKSGTTKAGEKHNGND